MAKKSPAQSHPVKHHQRRKNDGRAISRTLLMTARGGRFEQAQERASFEISSSQSGYWPLACSMSALDRPGGCLALTN